MNHDDPFTLPGEFAPLRSLESAAPIEPVPAVVWGECWRCGKDYSIIKPRCPFCQARNEHAPLDLVDAAPSEAEEHDRPLRIAMWTYAISLVAGLIFGGIAHLTLLDVTEVTLEMATTLAYQMFALEAVDTVVIVVALLLCGRIALRQTPSVQTRFAAWVAAVPLLAAMLGLNLAYHAAILKFTGSEVVEDELLKFPQLLNLLIVLICVQPAIVEELFMRQLFLGVLDRYMGLQGAVWVSAVAFGMLHLASPLSIPYLILLGGVLGYLRVNSGGIALPILFHFAHNAAVVAIEVSL